MDDCVDVAAVPDGVVVDVAPAVVVVMAEHIGVGSGA